MFINDGHGAFEDRSSWSNLGDQIFVLNVAHADFDNDGNLDVLLMHGAWKSQHGSRCCGTREAGSSRT